MRELTMNEIEEVNGAFDIVTSAALTVGLMACAPASVLVITAGLVALAFYGTASVYKAPINQ